MTECSSDDRIWGAAILRDDGVVAPWGPGGTASIGSIPKDGSRKISTIRKYINIFKHI